MQYSVGDKVIHPQYGPGQIACIEGSEAANAEARYYVIDIPRKGLMVHTPVTRADDLGIRLAMSPSGSRRILSVLRARPKHLPDDFRARQEQIGARLGTGQLAEVASVVRDLSWRQKLVPLTKKDSDLLTRALELLTGELALVSGETVSEARELVGATLTAAMAGVGK